jgi:hypothetical protein
MGKNPFVAYIEDVIRARYPMGPACDWWVKKNGWGLLVLVKHFGWFKDTLDVLRRPESIEYLKQGNNLSDLFGFLLGEQSRTTVATPQINVPQNQNLDMTPCPVCGQMITFYAPQCPSCLEPLRWD